MEVKDKFKIIQEKYPDLWLLYCAAWSLGYTVNGIKPPIATPSGRSSAWHFPVRSNQ